MRIAKLLTLFVCMFLAPPAFAAGQMQYQNKPTQPSYGITATRSATVGASHGNALAANVVTTYLLLHNPSAAGGNTIYCSFGGTATVAGAGTVSIAPGQYVVWESSYAPRDAIDCIATGASTPLTIMVQ